jgi:hypothetical protein
VSADGFASVPPLRGRRRYAAGGVHKTSHAYTNLYPMSMRVIEIESGNEILSIIHQSPPHRLVATRERFLKWPEAGH